MKAKIILSMLMLFACAAIVSAQKITREQADKIAINYLKSEMGPEFLLYVNDNTPNDEGFVVITSKEETIKAKYACWVYVGYQVYAYPTMGPPPPLSLSYLFVKEDNGNLLKVVTSNDAIPGPSSWTAVKIPQGIVETKEDNNFLYPNPVDDWLTVPCNVENVRVEIYDLKGVRLFSEMLSGDNSCRLNVSFLDAGTYLVSVGGETYRIIKR